jgi:hypothetical protein
MNIESSCYEGWRVMGMPEVVMERGEVLVQTASGAGPWEGRAVAKAVAV